MEERKRLLVVDDCTDTSETLAALLWLWGYEVKRASDGPSAVETALAFRPHLVLLDIAMPGMDGFAVARALRCLSGLEGLTLVALTGYGYPGGPRRAWEAGFDHYLLKPVDPEELRETLRGALSGTACQPLVSGLGHTACASPH
jgi:CheY-like chemotaxis protein